MSLQMHVSVFRMMIAATVVLVIGVMSWPSNAQYVACRDSIDKRDFGVCASECPFGSALIERRAP